MLSHSGPQIRLRHPHFHIHISCIGLKWLIYQYYAGLCHCQWNKRMSGCNLDVTPGFYSNINDVTITSWLRKSTGNSTVYWTVCLGLKQSLYYRPFVGRNHRSLVDSPHKWPVNRKTIPWPGVIWLGGKTSCYQISRNLQASRYGFRVVRVAAKAPVTICFFTPFNFPKSYDETF